MVVGGALFFLFCFVPFIFRCLVPVSSPPIVVFFNIFFSPLPSLGLIEICIKRKKNKNT